MTDRKLAEGKQPNNVARAPDYRNIQCGIAIWENEDKNGNPYLSVHIPLLGIKENCFPANKQE